MMRIGIGEDLHRIDDGRTLILGGVIIEEGPGLIGHSDADVLLHAITDAVLGAAALETQTRLGLSFARYQLLVTAAERRQALGDDPSFLTALDRAQR